MHGYYRDITQCEECLNIIANLILSSARAYKSENFVYFSECDLMEVAMWQNANQIMNIYHNTGICVQAQHISVFVCVFEAATISNNWFQVIDSMVF